jgi:hypothetical protein
MAAIMSLADSAAAQYFGPGPGRGGFSIRSPFFDMDLSPYDGGRIRTPYSRMLIPPGGFPAAAPPGFGLSYRSWRPPMPDGYFAPGIELSPRYADPRTPADRYGTVSPIPNGSISDGTGIDVPPGSGGPIPNPQSVPPLSYEIPSYAEVFPDDASAPNANLAAERIGGDIRATAEILRNSLEKRTDGEVWIKYLRLNELVAFTRKLNTIDNASRLLVEVESYHVNFDAAAASPQLGWLRGSPGFDELRKTLDGFARSLAEIPTVYNDAADGGDSPNVSSGDGPAVPPNPETGENEGSGQKPRELEELPAPPPVPVRKPASVFRAEI